MWPSSSSSSSSSVVSRKDSKPDHQESISAKTLPLVSSNRRPIHHILHHNPKRHANPRSNNLERVSYIPPHEEIRLRNEVRQTRILFESLRMHLSLPSSDPKPVKRTDMTAGSKMNARNLWLYREKRIVGSLPGICIGDVFFYRMEMCVVGLHGQVQAGIDSLTASQSLMGDPVATSIVISGGYEDDEDKGDEVIYTGHGGKENAYDTKQTADQKLEGSNLALERSCYNGIEVRLIRGLDYPPSPSRRIYVYDGLYNVVECKHERGRSGFRVYKFKLVRMEGQGGLGSDALRLAQKLKSSDSQRRRKDGYIEYDVSKGKERFPISVFNDIDIGRYPLKCEYLVKPTFKSVLMKNVGGKGCACLGQCKLNKCSCLEKNGGELVYDDNGKLIKGKPVIYECGKHCRCSSSCGNRVSEKGLRHRLEIFRSNETAWGVRSLDLICAGEFVCEISGVILTEEEGEVADRLGRELVHPGKFPERWREWGDLTKLGYGSNLSDDREMEDVGYVLDVTKMRNVGCYISHSCNPNVFVQYLLNNHYDMRYPRLMVFAMENIPPMRELSLDYGVVQVD